MAAKTVMMPGKALEAIRSNDANFQTISLSNSSSFQMNPSKYAGEFAEAMTTNTSVTNLDLSGCSIASNDAEGFANMLRKNKTLKNFSLSKNKISSEGVELILKALKDNDTLTEINLLEAGPTRLGESALSALCDSLETNVSLTKVIWRLDSRQAWKITKFLSRNVEIERRIAQGKPVDDIHPAYKTQGTPAPSE